MSSSPSSSDDEEGGTRLESLDISNDQHYKPSKELLQQQQLLRRLNKCNLDIPIYGSPTIQHSLPAYDLWHPFFPTWLGEEKLQHFHRPKLRHYNTGPQAKFRYVSARLKPYPVKNLARSLLRYQKKMRNRVISAINQGCSRDEIIHKCLLIREAHDLTAKQGELILFEYCEEFPPVLSQIGMASNVKTIIPVKDLVRPMIVTEHPKVTKRTEPTSSASNGNSMQQSNSNIRHNQDTQLDNNQDLPQKQRIHDFEVPFQDIPGYIEKTPFVEKGKQLYFNKMRLGQPVQVIENNLYRAPIYRHKMSSCDFLIIRTRQSLYIRYIPTIYTVGQTMPLVTIPPPNFSSISRFRCDLSNYYINKMFRESEKESPYKIMNFDELMRLFPDYNRNNLMKRITSRGAKRGPPGNPSTFLQANSNFGYMSLKQLRESLTPESYCLNMSMLAARERLRELNYTESMIIPSKTTSKADMEVEVLAAPWNTSSAIADAQKGRVFLDFKDHLIDPTGLAKEGFSCVPWVKSETEEMQRQQQVSGASSNTPASQMTSTPIKLPLNKNPLAFKINREKMNRLAIYTAEAQRLAHDQAQVLASTEILSSEEDDDDIEDDSDELNASFDQQLEDLDRMVVGGQTTEEINFQREEEERRQLIKDLNIHTPEELDAQTCAQSPTKTDKDSRYNLKRFENKILKITRTYDSPEGLIERDEIVREPKIIALYLKQKTGHDPASAPSSQNRNKPNGQASKLAESFQCDNGPPASSRRYSLPNYGNRSNGSFSKDFANKTTLGPSQLCRTDGIKITISKKVLDPRILRHHRRESRQQDMDSS